MVFSLLASAISALFRLGPWAAWASALLLGTALVGYAVVSRDAFFRRLLVFGAVVGLGELVSDHFAVVTTGTLVYPPVGPFLVASPAYMPLAWMGMMAQLGSLADVATRRWGLARATLGLMVLGGINIPFYETMARRAGFWHYRSTPMIFGATPWYVILGEVLLSAALPLAVSGVSRRGVWGAVLLGVAQAAWTYASSVLAFALVGR